MACASNVSSVSKLSAHRSTENRETQYGEFVQQDSLRDQIEQFGQWWSFRFEMHALSISASHRWAQIAAHLDKWRDSESTESITWMLHANRTHEFSLKVSEASHQFSKHHRHCADKSTQLLQAAEMKMSIPTCDNIIIDFDSLCSPQKPDSIH